MSNFDRGQNQALFFAHIARVFSLCMAFILAACVGGCSDDGEPPVSTISGTVTFQGKPVTGGTLTFEMTTENGAVPYAGQIEPDGRYEITNAVPGKARISVETATQEGLPNFFPLPGRFANPTTSGLEYQVKEGIQQHNIVVE